MSLADNISAVGAVITFVGLIIFLIGFVVRVCRYWF